MSQPLKLDKTDTKKILIGSVIAATGAILTYLEDALPGVNLGKYTPVMVMANSILANIFRKLVVRTQ